MSTVYRTAFLVNMKRDLVQFERQRQRTKMKKKKKNYFIYTSHQRTNRLDMEHRTRTVSCRSEASIYADTLVHTAETWKKFLIAFLS